MKLWKSKGAIVVFLLSFSASSEIRRNNSKNLGDVFNKKWYTIEREKVYLHIIMIVLFLDKYIYIRKTEKSWKNRKELNPVYNKL